MITSKDKTILTVSQLTTAIKNNLENEYRFVRISGEISNVKTPFSGHSYFTLKDANAQIRAVLFKQQKRFVALKLADGQDVVCFGRVTVYEPRGEYQLVVDSVELFGAGQLQQEFERLKEKLAAQGYFETRYKKAIPAFPKNIIVISSPTGAALQDFLKIVRMRQAPLQIKIIPTLVQGKDAPADICRALILAEKQPETDVIVLCRGGGSLEDLWAFNDEQVADAIFRCPIPIITGIGHEIDFTIADFCADFRAPTPTAAAETLSADSASLMLQIDSCKKRLQRMIGQKFGAIQMQLNHSIKLLGGLTSRLASGEHRLNMSQSYLQQAMNEYLSTLENRVNLRRAQLEAQAPVAKVRLQERQLSHLKKALLGNMKHIITRHEAKLGTQAALLNSVSPLATLARGYSVVRKRDITGKLSSVVTDSAAVNAGDRVHILLHQGQLDCLVTEKNNS
ncbi:exodeoxyribonuclease VII large subunit [Desulforhopalus sp. IMCC35007]|uniref:exodeoxyribonuclease VII large subunit n=1 Tax=Desulforhopalus sp. IMCC35007 TaxID=2569543 RepID=UPI0010AE58EB|nr:exodeoxyribonuclease VII large subunit [Desulforhopalus sp. IMCC35007]TKB11096.1 exodeoxyribonuclease VII large subunit [Desulforhopalus sp. IMCC35007]